MELGRNTVVAAATHCDVGLEVEVVMGVVEDGSGFLSEARRGDVIKMRMLCCCIDSDGIEEGCE